MKFNSEAYDKLFPREDKEEHIESPVEGFESTNDGDNVVEGDDINGDNADDDGTGE